MTWAALAETLVSQLGSDLAVFSLALGLALGLLILTALAVESWRTTHRLAWSRLVLLGTAGGLLVLLLLGWLRWGAHMVEVHVTDLDTGRVQVLPTRCDRIILGPAPRLFLPDGRVLQPAARERIEVWGRCLRR